MFRRTNVLLVVLLIASALFAFALVKADPDGPGVPDKSFGE